MGYSIVNILGGLLIVTSTMVVVSKNIKHAIRWYACLLYTSDAADEL